MSILTDMSRIKVLHLSKYHSPFNGGIENFLRDLLRCGAFKAECETRVIAHHHEPGEPTCRTKIDGVSIIRVKLWRRIFYAPICFGFLNELQRELRYFEPDILHIHMPNLSAFACFFSRKARKCRWIIHWHSDVLGAEPDWRVRFFYNLYRILERRLLTNASSIICTSPNYLGTSNALSSFKNKCVVIPIGIAATTKNKPTSRSDEKFVLDVASCQTGEENSSDVSPLNLICIGRLTYYKGHSVLLNAIANLDDVYLNVIGEGENRAAIESQIDSLGLQSKVTLHGEVSEESLAQHIMASHLLCLPSIERTEAFGLVILEAARCRRAALVTDVNGSGMSWVVVDGKTGWVVAHNDVNAITTCLTELQQNKSVLVSAGDAAHARFTSHFQVDSVSKQILQLYRRCIQPIVQ